VGLKTNCFAKVEKETYGTSKEEWEGFLKTLEGSEARTPAVVADDKNQNYAFGPISTSGCAGTISHKSHRRTPIDHGDYCVRSAPVLKSTDGYHKSERTYQLELVRIICFSACHVDIPASGS